MERFMTSRTIADKTLNIDGMTGHVCVAAVKDALKGVEGVETRSVKIGTAEITTDDRGCKAACAAIGRAGYKASENNSGDVQTSDAQSGRGGDRDADRDAAGADARGRGVNADSRTNSGAAMPRTENGQSVPASLSSQSSSTNKREPREMSGAAVNSGGDAEQGDCTGGKAPGMAL